MKRVLFALLAMVTAPAFAFSLFSPNVDAVKDLLNDPYSAKFEDVKTVPNGAVCGFVNAKNKFGAYTGKKLFAIYEGRAVIDDADGSDAALYCIRAKDCATRECVTEMKDVLDKDRQNREAEKELQSLRLPAESVCKARLSGPHQDYEAAVMCGAEYNKCRGELESRDELDCLVRMVNKYAPKK